MYFTTSYGPCVPNAIPYPSNPELAAWYKNARADLRRVKELSEAYQMETLGIYNRLAGQAGRIDLVKSKAEWLAGV